MRIRDRLKSEGQQGVVKVGNYVGKNAQTVQTSLAKKKLQVTVIGGNKKITAQSLTAGKEAIINSRLILKTSGEMKMCIRDSRWGGRRGAGSQSQPLTGSGMLG